MRRQMREPARRLRMRDEPKELGSAQRVEARAREQRVEPGGVLRAGFRRALAP